jgi:hypothetical protein
MIALSEEIYTVLSGIGDTYFNMLPADPNTSGLLLVYELNEASSYSALDRSNFANDLDLTVKILHPNTVTLLQTAEQIKASFLDQPFQQIKGIEYENSVPVFWDRELQTNQYTLLFSVFKLNDQQ